MRKRALRIIRQHAGVLLLCLMLLPAGCGSRGDVREARDLRLAGRIDSAYAFVRSRLEVRPDRMDLWLEFARCALEQSRIKEDEDLQSRSFLMEAAIVCAARNRLTKLKPGRDWLDIGRRVAGQVGRRVNRYSAIMTSQSQNAMAFRQLVPRADSLSRKNPENEKLRRATIQFQAGARELLYGATVMRLLLEALPELTPGSAEMLSGQLRDDQIEWISALELEPEFAEFVAEQATRAVNHALQRATDDLEELGYFLPSTILENGVFS